MKPSELPSEYLSLAKKRAFLGEWDIYEEDNLAAWFSWHKTPQGYDFWDTCHEAKTVEELPPLSDDTWPGIVTWVQGKSNDVEQVGQQFGRTGGPDHYSNLKIKPSEFIVENNLGWCEGNVVKYVSRHQHKGGADDIRKAIDYLEEILSRQYDISEN